MDTRGYEVGRGGRGSEREKKIGREGVGGGEREISRR
jgi:hypothetical protein